jgi:hypothetical protein
LPEEPALRKIELNFVTRDLKLEQFPEKHSEIA